MEIKKVNYYSDVQSLLDVIDTAVTETDTVLDIGCGIVPMSYFRPKLHIMVEPWDEYSNVLNHRHANDKSVIILKMGAIGALAAFHDNSVDSIFLLDVIEHLEKEDGMKIIAEIERVARHQAVIFTPFGFMPQHMDSDETDAWGLSGGKWQEHKSGWIPEDFGAGWEFHVCECYHDKDFRGQLLEKPYGAFFAIRNFQLSAFLPSFTIPEIRRPLPSEIALQKVQGRLLEITEKNRVLSEEIDSLKSAQHELFEITEKNRVLTEVIVNLESAQHELIEIKRQWPFKLANMMHRLFSLHRR